MKISLFFLGLLSMFLKALGVPFFATASWWVVTSPLWIIPVYWFASLVALLFGVIVLAAFAGKFK